VRRLEGECFPASREALVVEDVGGKKLGPISLELASRKE
jgi:hypothetical protein